METVTHVQSFIASMLGGIISLVYAKHLSPTSSVLAIIISGIFSYYLSAPLAERFHIPLETASFIVSLGSLRLGAKLVAGDFFRWRTEGKDKTKSDIATGPNK